MACGRLAVAWPFREARLRIVSAIACVMGWCRKMCRCLVEACA
jgi:hypothetical protein